MKLLRILPAAAGVIALTATVSFAEDGRDRKDDPLCRTIVAVSHSCVIAPDKPNHYAPPLNLAAEAALYHVKVMRGDKTHLVLIDAYSGKVVEKREAA